MTVPVDDLAKTYFREIVTAGDLVEFLPAALPFELEGDPRAGVDGVASLADVSPDTLFYAAVALPAESAKPVLRGTIAICSKANRHAVAAAARIVVDDPRAAFIAVLSAMIESGGIDYARTIREMASQVRRGRHHIHRSAIIDDDVVIGDGVSIGPNVVIGCGTIIGENTVVRSATTIGESGAAIHLTAQGDVLSQPHVGAVWIGPGCEIGVHSAIIRAMLGATRIGAGSRLGNFVNIGHGVQLGARTWIGVGSLVGGHARIGEGATIGMGAAIRDNLSIGAGSSVAMGSVVTKSVPDGASVFGNPARISAGRLTAGPRR